jgi:hypothetical protein
VNRVDTTFDIIHTYNFFPTEESPDRIKLKEAAEAKIRAFIEMLNADARFFTEGEEIKSHDLFAKLTSKKTITGEDEQEERVLEYLTEIRDVRDKSPESFDKRIYGAPALVAPLGASVVFHQSLAWVSIWRTLGPPAISKTVNPFLSLAVTSAPRASSSWTISSLSAIAANISAV